MPEISAGTVEIKSIAREPGSRSKIAVATTEERVDPIGSMIGQKGTRVQAVINELAGEKIDIVEWSEDPAEFIKGALSPAKVIEVKINDKKNQAEVIVPEDQLSLAIGIKGQNVRLAAKLTNWKIDIVAQKTDGKKEKVKVEKDKKDKKKAKKKTKTTKEKTKKSSKDKSVSNKKTAKKTKTKKGETKKKTENKPAKKQINKKKATKKNSLK